MRSLDQRLSTIAAMVAIALEAEPTSDRLPQARKVLADVGSDHGYLLASLLRSGVVRRGIAIEKNPTPLERSRKTLRALDADVRLADGLDGLAPDEADCLAISGMGGELIAQILERNPHVIPDRVVLQPNCHEEVVRRWMYHHQFAIFDEQWVYDKNAYTIIGFRRIPSGRDASYEGLDHELAIRFGPKLLKRRDPEWLDWVSTELERLQSYPKLNFSSQAYLEQLNQIVASSFDTNEPIVKID
ncbi:MAG: class I SAM-dependent methyltransferase [Planctomycetota bacterium]